MLLPYAANLAELGRQALERDDVEHAGQRLNPAPFHASDALIAPDSAAFVQGFARSAAKRPALQGGRYRPAKWQKGRFPALRGVGDKLRDDFFREVLNRCTHRGRFSLTTPLITIGRSSKAA